MKLVDMIYFTFSEADTINFLNKETMNEQVVEESRLQRLAR